MLPRRHRLGIRGQISIVAAALMATTFFLFFAFVVNTGMIVHAKINLQNAADMAAYAGAATQARQLEKIGLLNYDLRQQYKKFLFRYYVLGNLSRLNASGSGGSSSPSAAQEWEAQSLSAGGRASGFVNFNVPAICLVFKENDNYCRIFNLDAVDIAAQTSGVSAFLDPIGGALKDVLTNIEAIRQQNCSGLSFANLIAAYLWLFNTDEQGSSALLQSPSASNPEARLAFQTLSAITQGLGLIPRNLITYQRIQTQRGFVNNPPQRDLRSDSIQTLESDPQPMQHERTVLAFKSAQRTLGPNIFDSDSVSMSELLPNSPMLDLETVSPEFTVYATSIEKNGNSCRQRLIPIIVSQGMAPLAVRKKTTSTVYYAVRLRAKPRLLFNAFGDLTLEAYAAAKPFGSRLGPQAGDDQLWTRPAEAPREFLDSSTPVGPAKTVPNLPLSDDDRFNRNLGFNRKAALRTLTEFINGAPGNTLSIAQIQAAEAALLVPNEAEFGRYIIPTDSSTPNQMVFREYFEGRTLTSFHAPIVASPTLSAEDAVRQTLNQIPTTTQNFANLKRDLNSKLGIYFSKLRGGRGENGEGLQVARIQNPHLDVQGNPAKDLLKIQLSDKRLLSSFGGQDLGPFHPEGKVGYSVKLVSLRSLLEQPGAGFDPDLQSVGSVIDH